MALHFLKNAFIKIVFLNKCSKLSSEHCPLLPTFAHFCPVINLPNLLPHWPKSYSATWWHLCEFSDFGWFIVTQGEPKVETTSESSHETKTLEDGTVVNMSSSKKTSSSSQEMTIPITFGDMPKMSKSPRPRLMPFAFPNLPDLPEMQISSLPMPSIRVGPFPKSPLKWLPTILVVPIGTQSWDKKFESACLHARLPMDHRSFSTVA